MNHNANRSIHLTQSETETINIRAWAQAASEGDYLALYHDMTAEETKPGYYVVTHDDSDAVIWEGAAATSEEAYAIAETADHGSTCGWSDMQLSGANAILARRNLILLADDRGLRVVERDGEEPSAT